MKCHSCKSEIAFSFLKKIRGAYVRKDGKRVAICNACQKKLKGED